MTDEDVIEPPERDYRAARSFSQLDQYSDCGLKYKLTRVDKVPQRPAVWFIGGRAIHTFIEHAERVHLSEGGWPSGNDSRRFFSELFEAELTETVLANPDVDPEDYRAAKKGTEDIDWWRDNGPDWAELYVSKRQDDPRKVLILPDGRPALELEFTIDVEGVPYRGFIDQVLRYPNGDLEVRDVKAGARQPSGTIQLGSYWWALLYMLGNVSAGRLPQGYGRYYMARKGSDTFAVDFANNHPWSEIVYWVHTMDRAERAGIYMPRVSSFCVSCSVAEHCPTKTGVWK